MADAAFDVVGIGDAIVDVIAIRDESFLAEEQLAKGTMTLIDDARATALTDRIGEGVEASGGSAGNTMAAIASLGGKGAFIGKVRDDRLGRVYRSDLTGIGVTFNTPEATNGPGTGRCLIVVTADGQRTMATYLGIAVELGPDEVDPRVVTDAKVTYLEGYLFDPPQAKEAFHKAARLAHAAGRKVALSLSDPFCVARHRDAFRELVDGSVDILFANEAEICSLYQTEDFAAAVDAVRGHVGIAALTRSEHGSVILAGGATHAVKAAPVARVVDTTGAGDLYAAGFLFGLTNGRPLPTCGAIGSLCAAEIISHVGARPAVNLAGLLRDSGLG
jgi:sugar/nucleoside kinase (ribokinase family)